jgi:hypothetical protein
MKEWFCEVVQDISERILDGKGPKYSASGNFVVPRNKVTSALANRMIDDLFVDEDPVVRYPPSREKIQGLVYNQVLQNNLLFTWDVISGPVCRDGYSHDINVNNCQHPHHPKFNFDPDRYQIFSFITNEREFNPHDPEHMEHLAELFMSVFEVLEPAYGWCDLYRYLLKFKGKDPRGEVFGLTFYSWNMADRIGHDLIETSPVHAVEELDHGFLLQLMEEPFSGVPSRVRKDVRDHLRLHEVWKR